MKTSKKDPARGPDTPDLPNYIWGDKMTLVKRVKMAKQYFTEDKSKAASALQMHFAPVMFGFGAEAVGSTIVLFG